MATSAVPPSAHRPGPVSLFFVAKAAVFAAGFWGWLLLLAVRDDPLAGAHLVAAAGAITTTLVSVVLGARLATQRNAADRHAELKKLLVDISWNAFTAAGNAGNDGPANVVPFPSSGHDTPLGRMSGDNGDRDRRR
nr:hypothetical protein [Micromonospora sp. DSM 115978]